MYGVTVGGRLDSRGGGRAVEDRVDVIFSGGRGGSGRSCGG